jgi:hypothetical protein
MVVGGSADENRDIGGGGAAGRLAEVGVVVASDKLDLRGRAENRMKKGELARLSR